MTFGPCCLQVLSKYQAPHCPVPALRIFDDTDLSIDRFPFSEAQARADARQQRRPPLLSRKRRRRGARAQSRRRGWGPCTPRPRPPPQVPPHPRKPSLRPHRSTPRFHTPRPPLGPPTGCLQPLRLCCLSRTQALPPCLTTSKLCGTQEEPTPPECVETDEAGKLLPAIASECAGMRGEGPRGAGGQPTPPSLSHAEDGLSLTVYRSKMEPTVRVSVPTEGARGWGARPRPPRPSAWPAAQGPRPPGVPEERGPGLPDGGAVGAEQGQEQALLTRVPAHHRGRVQAGVGLAVQAPAPAGQLRDPDGPARGRAPRGRGGAKRQWQEAGGVSCVIY